MYRRSMQGDHAFCRIFSQRSRTRPGHGLQWPHPREGQTRREAGTQSRRASRAREAAGLPKGGTMRTSHRPTQESKPRRAGLRGAANGPKHAHAHTQGIACEPEGRSR